MENKSRSIPKNFHPKIILYRKNKIIAGDSERLLEDTKQMEK